MSSRWINRNHTPDSSLHVADDNTWGFLCETWTLSVVFHPGWCFIFFSFFFPSAIQTFTSGASVLCLSPPPLSPLGWGAISGHAFNLILLMPLAPKDHLVRIVRVMCYFQDTQAWSCFPCLPQWDFFLPWFSLAQEWAVYLHVSLVLSVHWTQWWHLNFSNSCSLRVGHWVTLVDLGGAKDLALKSIRSRSRLRLLVRQLRKFVSKARST